jgi:hypothetical protein
VLPDNIQVINGVLFFGKEGLNNLQVIIGMVLDRYSWNDMVWKRIC